MKLIHFVRRETYMWALSAKHIVMIGFSISAAAMLTLTAVLIETSVILKLFGVGPETIASIIVLSLILMLPILTWQAKPNLWVWLGIGFYVLSYFTSNAFTLAPHLLDPPYAYGFALRLYQANALLLVVVYCGTVFYALTKGIKFDRQAQLVWLVLLIAESFQLVEYIGCKVTVDPIGRQDLPLAQVWAVEVSKYACGRLHGWYTPYIAPVITTLYLLFITRMELGDEPRKGNRA